MSDRGDTGKGEQTDFELTGLQHDVTRALVAKPDQEQLLALVERLIVALKKNSRKIAEEYDKVGEFNLTLAIRLFGLLGLLNGIYEAYGEDEGGKRAYQTLAKYGCAETDTIGPDKNIKEILKKAGIDPFFIRMLSDDLISQIEEQLNEEEDSEVIREVIAEKFFNQFLENEPDTIITVIGTPPSGLTTEDINLLNKFIYGISVLKMYPRVITKILEVEHNKISDQIREAIRLANAREF